jgi:NADH-quinone oxidoreductase subunit G
MNRCIHCTRCIRFATEVAGVAELGATGRGEDMEVTTYLQHAMTSELQGNVIDLCPVGALTSKPYSFKARAWELNKTESIDVMDALGSAIRVDTRGRAVMRVLPRTNEAVNEEWISDKTRFAFDGLMVQRLDRAYVRGNGKLRPASWNEAFRAVAERVGRSVPGRIAALAGDLAAVEEMFALKRLMEALGSPHLDCRQDGAPLHPRHGRASYVFNATIEGIEAADAILIVGSNPRKEAPVLNARIRKRWRVGGLSVGVIGEAVDLTYPYRHLGAGPDSLRRLVEGGDEFIDVLSKAERPLVLVGQGALARPDGAAVLAAAARLATQAGALGEDWNGFSVLHTAAARVGGLDLGFVPGEGGYATRDIVAAAGRGEIDTLFLVGADEIDMRALGQAFVVYIGTHGDAGAHRADVILPGAAYTEKSGIYVNTEGRVQLANRAVFPPGEAREDWAILRALSGVLGRTLPFDSLPQLRLALFLAHPHMRETDAVAAGSADHVRALGRSESGRLDGAPFLSPVRDFYMTNPIARASSVMAECSAQHLGPQAEAAE